MPLAFKYIWLLIDFLQTQTHEQDMVIIAKMFKGLLQIRRARRKEKQLKSTSTEAGENSRSGKNKVKLTELHEF